MKLELFSLAKRSKDMLQAWIRNSMEQVFTRTSSNTITLSAQWFDRCSECVRDHIWLHIINTGGFFYYISLEKHCYNMDECRLRLNEKDSKIGVKRRPSFRFYLIWSLNVLEPLLTVLMAFLHLKGPNLHWSLFLCLQLNRYLAVMTFLSSEISWCL